MDERNVDLMVLSGFRAVSEIMKLFFVEKRNYSLDTFANHSRGFVDLIFWRFAGFDTFDEIFAIIINKAFSCCLLPNSQLAI